VLSELKAIGAIGPVQGRIRVADAPVSVETPKGPLDEAKVRSLCIQAIERLDQIGSVVQDLREVFTEINESLETKDERDSDGGT
jgi:hypothetical protein